MTERAKPCKQTQVSKKWLAIYSRPRWEKKVAQLLHEKGFECYCPLNKIRRKWSDRVKVVEEPLFKSYVFVRVEDKDRTAVRMTPGVVNFVYWGGKPGVVKDREISAIKMFLGEYENVEVQSMEPQLNQRVKVLQGPMIDREGKVIGLGHKTVKVAIESMGYILVAHIDKTKITATD